jgi:DNA-binding transcriptional regulator YhcF (GntR family)
VKSLGDPSPALAAAELPFRSLTSAVLAHLRAEILSAHLRPGERILIAGVAKRLGVGPSAVREALSRLAVEGLVRGENQRGFCVTPVSIEDLRDVTRTRVDLEGLALRRSVELGDARWEEGVRAAHAEQAAVPLPLPAGPGRSSSDGALSTSDSTWPSSPAASRGGCSGSVTCSSSSPSVIASCPTASSRATSRASTG